MALRAARSRLRTGPARHRPAADVLLSSELLPLRSGSDELLRVRSAEFARVSCAQGVARAAAGRTIGVHGNDRRGHAACETPARSRAPAPGLRSADAESEHHDVPL